MSIPFMDDIPRSFKVFGDVFTSDVIPEEIVGGFIEEVGSRGEGFDAIEFLFDGVVDGFDIGLPCMGGGGYGLMDESGDSLDGDSEDTVGGGIPRADEFAAVIGLETRVAE